MSDADLESRIVKAITGAIVGVLAIYRFGSAGTLSERPASPPDKGGNHRARSRARQHWLP
jgi:hypothetical protein